MTAVRWEDPPTRRNGNYAGGHWVTILTPLMEQPERWARIAEKDTPAKACAAASNLRRGTLKLPPGRWEFAARTVDDGAHAIFARYIGPGGAA